MTQRLYLVANLIVVLLATACLVVACPSTLAHAQNPAMLDRVLHQVQHHKPGELAPDIGFVFDQDHDVMCYFPKRLHWFDAQPNISCVYLGVNMLADDKDVPF